MPTFMWASGFVYILSLRVSESYRHFLIRKAQRLLLPYLIVSAIVVTIKLLTQSVLYVENPVTAISYLRIFYLPKAAYYFWYIWALLLIFLIVPLFRTPKSRLILLLGSFALYLVVSELPELFCINQAIRFLPYFALGMSACDYAPIVSSHIKKLHPSIIAVASMFLLLAVASIYLTGDTTNNKIHEYACGIFGITAIIAMSYAYSRSRMTAAPIVLLGNASFIIYLFHTTFQGFGKAISKIFNSLGVPLSPVVDLMIVYIFAMGMTLLLYFIFRRYRPTARLFGLKHNRPAA